MTHLGDRVAAFVDGQLSGDEHDAALDHLEGCSDCRSVVGQQRLLKHRMTGLNAVPAPPASLVSSLADPARMCGAGQTRSRLARFLRLPTVRALVALTGASVTVTAIAYAVGPPVPEDDDLVSPPVQQFVSEFTTASSPLRPVHAARTTTDLGIRRVSAITHPSAPRGDSTEALSALGRVTGAAGGETLDLLSRNFDLSVGRIARVDGHRAVQVLAGRRGRLVASYWIDESTGTLLRRVAYDRTGMPISRSEAGQENLRAISSVRTGGEASASPISRTAMTSLSRSGWPCHDVLAGDMHRVEGRWTEGREEQIVTLTYTDGVSTLSLFEQRGALDAGRLTGFDQAEVGGAPVWVRPGSPTVATWDDAGVVYTVVTDAGRRQLDTVLGNLPRRPRGPGVVSRVGGGIERLAAWADPIGRA